MGSALNFISILLYVWYFFQENRILDPEGDSVSVTLDRISGLGVVRLASLLKSRS